MTPLPAPAEQPVRERRCWHCNRLVNGKGQSIEADDCIACWPHRALAAAMNAAWGAEVW